MSHQDGVREKAAMSGLGVIKGHHRNGRLRASENLLLHKSSGNLDKNGKVNFLTTPEISQRLATIQGSEESRQCCALFNSDSLIFSLEAPPFFRVQNKYNIYKLDL